MAQKSEGSGERKDESGGAFENSQHKPESKEEANEDNSDEDEEEDEPRLKYNSLTKYLRPLYRNGDATSTFLVGGDKMIVGTHNGYIYVLSLPSFQVIKSYHAHSASISSLSISPFPPPLPVTKPDAVQKIKSNKRVSPARSFSSSAEISPNTKSARHAPLNNNPSNSIYIGSSSIDGNVCVASLADPKDVLLRNFGRPLKSVVLSPDYKNDRSYLSGGLTGSLVLTTGGQSGKTSVSNTAVGGTALGSSWLGAIGLGSNTGKDQILHSGEGTVSTIKWSLSGLFVVWVNEKGIKIMRSHLHLETGEGDFSWKRISHIDHPKLPGWDEMAGVWQPHVEWIDVDGLESDDDYRTSNGVLEASEIPMAGIFSNQIPLKPAPRIRQVEKMVVGWSGTIWIIDVHPGSHSSGKESGERKAGRVELVTILRTDCIISGISLYTPNLLLVLAYIPPGESNSSSESNQRRGVHRRQNAVQPEVRIIDINTQEEVSVPDTLHVSRFEGLSATDYHLGVLPALRLSDKAAPTRGTLEVIGGGIWDATMYPTKLFSSGASIRSNLSLSEVGSSKAPSDFNSVITKSGENMPSPLTLSHSMKVFIHSPYDCVLATRTTLVDHLSWLLSHDKFEEAWKLVDLHPDVMSDFIEGGNVDSVPSTPMRPSGSLVEFFADDSSQSTISGRRDSHLQAEKEKRRIGERWLQQLISIKDWTKAGQVCGRVLETSSSWEHWVWVFAEANKYEEITSYIPTRQIQPPLPSVVYEIILGHYILTDRVRFQELLEIWSPDLFDASSVIEAIQGRLKGRDIREDSVEGGEVGRDWKILLSSLAKLYLANGQPRGALGCFIKLQNVDATMKLIGEHHLTAAISDDIPGFILLRVSKAQQKSAPLIELEEATREPIRLLVDEARHGIVPPATVIEQLQKRGSMHLYLFFYFRDLWNGETSTTLQQRSDHGRPSSHFLPVAERLTASEGQSLVSDHADLAVQLFATYDRALLMAFLRSSSSYTLERASRICEERSFIPELVYLLSKEGRNAQALRLITTNLNDISQAITFCKEQKDPSLWDDLLDYSMSKPPFIRGLLEEVGTAIEPITLVRRIPPGLEIKGLRDGLSRMIREYEIQHSISEGVARVLRGEVAAKMGLRAKGQRKGVKFNVAKSTTANKHGSHYTGASAPAGDPPKAQKQTGTAPHHPVKAQTGHCPRCGKRIIENDTQYLVGFACGHVFHLACLLEYGKTASDRELPDVLAQMASGEAPTFNYDRSIGPKVDHAALLRTVIGDGCPVEVADTHEGKD